MADKNNRREIVINYVPGEECRVAVVENGRLEEHHAERMESASHVGNIYIGKVTNVEAGIQAAFIDFGLEANGFLHVTDLHPRYFPGEDKETTERVGKKTPRRDRPPIQACLRRGQEIAVQVLKEGVGSKGPTLTSYLSIPGRFLVMMPQMDRVGVSRKVEDDEQRRKMRDILDQLDLPEGFGFILRTAGMDQTKTELKRDLAYLQRLWKDMEKRWKTGSKPRLLYSESDLLVRALRDMLATDIDRVVIDNESALNRAARFLKIVAPRTTTKLARYTGSTPIFHAMGIEQQLQMIHAREVPLPSGGRLVIDETEALVAIDVNSGKMRDARDAETTAYRTNMEAADEIARQLRLRDVGGVIINDFIDMRSMKHRRDLENRFKDNLKKDRARTTTATISPFGVLEMTRQRMRGSHESVHFAACPTCRARGLVQKPDSVASDGLRELQALLDHDKVSRVEMVVHPRIAGELLSTRRKALSRIERSMKKHVDVRISEAIPLDRLSFYAYDERGADLDVSRLAPREATADQLVPFSAPDSPEWNYDEPAAEVVEEPVEEEVVETLPLHPIEDESFATREEQRDGDRAERGGRRRRGGRNRRGGRDREDRDQAGSAPGRAADERSDRRPRVDADRDGPAPEPRTQDEGEPVEGREAPAGDERRADGDEPQEGRGRRRRRRGGRGRRRDGDRPERTEPAPAGQQRDPGDRLSPQESSDAPQREWSEAHDSDEGSPMAEGDARPHMDDQGEPLAGKAHADDDAARGPGARETDQSREEGRRRRRRRGGRGRNRNRDRDAQGAPAPREGADTGDPAGEPGMQGDGFADRDAQGEPDGAYESERFAPEAEGADDREVEGQEDRADDDGERMPDSPDTGDRDGQPAGEGGRRRRRRGGRGRRRGAAGAPDAQPERAPNASGNGLHVQSGRAGRNEPDNRGRDSSRAPGARRDPRMEPNRPPEGRGDRRRDDREQTGRGDRGGRDRGNRGDRADRARPAPQSAPTPPPAPAPEPKPVAPRPRTLYGVGRRKLTPVDLRSRPKED